jgi:beta-phosphoglucomutase-like phosphatase (HAD superfamily)
MDGTLVNSDAAVERAWTRWSAEHGVDPDAVLAIAHGSPPEPTVRRMLPGVDKRAVAVAAARQMSLQYDDLSDVVAAPGTATLLTTLACWPTVRIRRAGARLRPRTSGTFAGMSSDESAARRRRSGPGACPGG